VTSISGPVHLVRRRRRRPAAALAVAAAGVAVAAALLATFAWRLGRQPGGVREQTALAARLSIAGALSAGDAAGERGFARALAPRPFRFPADHGPHPEFRTEWWYYTGNLTARDGRRFGFQLTFFRVALAPPAPTEGGAAAATPAAAAGGSTSGAPPPRTSAWATRQVYFAHFAVTDVAGRRFQSWERWERDALGLAGARASPFRVWVGDWSAAAAGHESAGTPPMRLTATAGAEGATGAGLDLVLASALRPVPQGDRGLSPKSAEAGNASYYYSLPRLAAAGTLRLGAETVAVTGLAWMDREWSTSSLGPGEVGWDWFALQLDDGWELMLYRLRRRPAATATAAGRDARSPAASASGGGTAPGAELADPASRATLIAPDGRSELLPLSALRFAETGSWTSPATGVRYPSGWRLTRTAAAAGPGPGPAGFDLAVQPLLPDQELRLSLRYWEGAVAARGTHGGRPVSARGYVELTGYGEERAQPPP
jgi:predicted secreted hydrolase